MPTHPVSTPPTSARATAAVQEFPELLSNIFSLSVSKPVQIPVSPYEAPWNIAQVCSKWRHVALETPSLWNDIQIVVDYISAETEESCDSMLEEASIFLFRARKSAISLTLEAEEDVTPHACMATLFSVAPHLRQLQSLSLIPVERFTFPPQLDWGTANNLESLSLSFDFQSGNYIHPPASCLKGFDSAHNLHTLTISSDDAHLKLQIFKLPWSQLTQLEFNQTTIPFTGGHEVLRQCVNLVSLRLGIVSDDHCEDYASHTLLPHLQSLTVFVDLDEEYGQFLWPFVLPSLKHLKIESEAGSIWPDDESESAMLNTESLQNLEQLTVTHMESTAIYALLVDTPSLIELSMCSFPSTDSLEKLTKAICDGEIAPILRVLECDVGMVDSLVEILEARAKVAGDEESTSATIESVIIHGDPTDMPAMKESLNMFCSQGIYVRYVED